MTAGDSLRGAPGRRIFAGLGDWLQPANIGLLLCAVIAGWLVLVPLAALFYTAFAEDTIFGPGAFTLQNFVDAYLGRQILGVMWSTLVFATGTALVTFALGTAVAWVVERTDAPGRGLFHSLALMSFAIPGLLTTMAWMLVLSPNIGWVNTLMRDVFGFAESPFNIYSMGGMIWALSSHYFPLAYLLMGPAFRVLDNRMEEAAVMSGAGTLQVASRVTLPLLRPAILSTLLLLFIRGIESFEVPRLIGMPARIFVLTTDIQSATAEAPPKFGIAGALGLTLLLICVIGVYLYRRATKNAEAYATVTGKGYMPTLIQLRKSRWPVTIAIGVMFFLALGLPLFTLAWQSFFRNVSPPSIAALGAMNWDNYRYILGYPIFLNAVKNSVSLGAMAATIVVLLTFVMAWIAQRTRTRYGWTLDVLAFIPIAIPSVISGAAILFAYLIIPLPVYNTVWILLIAYVTMNMPYGMRFTASGLVQIHKELEEVAHMSGAGQFQTFRRVLLPLLAPVLIAAWLYIFVLAVRELSASIFLAGPGTHVLGTISLTMWEEGGSFGAVCALGIIQILPLIVIVMVMRRLETMVSNRG